MLLAEINKRILSCFGISKKFGEGITASSLKLGKTLTLEYEGAYKIDCPCYAGQINLQTSAFKVLFVDCSYNEGDEYLVIFCTSDGPIYSIWYYEADNLAQFKIFNQQWVNANLAMIASCWAGIEQITDFGLMFEPLNDYAELWKHAVTLCESL